MNTRRQIYITLASIVVSTSIAAFAQATGTLIRWHKMGEEEGGTNNSPVAFTLDSPVDGSDFQSLDLSAVNTPTYRTITGRPDGGGGIGIEFNSAASQYLTGEELNWPEDSSLAAINSGQYELEGIVARGFQLWVRPTSTTAQSLVMDTNRHGVRITSAGKFSMRFANVDYDSTVSVAANTWYHIELVRPGAEESRSRLLVNGVVAAVSAPADYPADHDTPMTVGATTAGDGEFFKGIIDDLRMYVYGTTTSVDHTQYGNYNFATDNAFAASPITGLKGVPGDVNNSGSLTQADKDAFIAGWMQKRIVNGFQIGDLLSHAQGDLNLDGITNIQDLLLMQNALSGAGMGTIIPSELAGVPEPASALLAVLAMLPIAAGRRARRRATMAVHSPVRAREPQSATARIAWLISCEDSMPTRREFLQQAALISSATTWSGAFPAAIAKAMAIDPEPHSTFHDAEHVVILMQENRSFDHTFGTLQGVRGFNDPRAISLPNGDPVWVQTNQQGESYVPFRLNIKDSNATWAGCLPHGRTDQVDARNGGRYDGWLSAKRSGEKQYAHMPLTLGYYTREDIPFYYALADAFTICDQHFCSALTCTTPNRLYLWTGTIRDKPTGDSPARLWNEDAIYEAEAAWTTFPERLEDRGISWKVYQNELTVPSGLDDEQNAWLANYGDNPLEYFTQYQVRFAASHRRYLEQQSRKLADEIQSLQSRIAASSGGANKNDSLEQQLDAKAVALRQMEQERVRWSAENYEKLSLRSKSLHSRAFSTNSQDADYRSLANLEYVDGDKKREVQVPKSDILRSFRDDVRNGQLPAVSWLVAPERFSDHPSSPWYGAWYIAEVMNILTKNPAVWKKTVFILTYDENDGYFDHVPPFVAPDPRRAQTGRVSAGIDTSVEYVERDQELKHRPAHQVRESSIGLGYRVPMIIASPWTRGGCVCSQVFDHTSVLQFLERWLSKKTGSTIDEPNISRWRRTVCGDLTSAFQTYDGPESGLPTVVERNAFIEGIHRAKFKAKPSGFKSLTQSEVGQIRRDVRKSPHMPRQEPGVHRSCPLPYEIVVEGGLNADRSQFTVRFEARNQQFGERAAGSPFIVYAGSNSRNLQVRDYAVAAGTQLEDSWRLADFENGVYDLRVYGPNGFYRQFSGSADDPQIAIELIYDCSSPKSASLSGLVTIEASNQNADHIYSVDIRDHARRGVELHRAVAPGTTAALPIDTALNYNWYDLSVQISGAKLFLRRYGGRVETGQWSFSDPAMGMLHGDA